MVTFIRVGLYFSLAFGTYALPAPQEDTQAAPKPGKFEWLIHKGCPKEQRDLLVKTWQDTKRLADSLNSWRPDADYQDAMTMYMGDRSTFKDDKVDFPAKIQETARRARGLHDGVSQVGNAKLWVKCNEDSLWFGKKCDDEKRAVMAYESEDKLFSNYYITFCPRFYELYLSLDDVLQKRADQEGHRLVAEWYAGSHAGVFFHEQMHMGKLITDPRTTDGDGIYGPKKVYDLARNKNTDETIKIADTWTWAATAIFAMNALDLDEPPHPNAYHSTSQGEIPTDVPTFKDETVEITDFVPEGAKPVGPDEEFFVDPNVWETYDFGPIPSCYGEHTFKQPEATAAIDKYCSDSRWTKTTLAASVSNGRGQTANGRGKALGVTDTIPLEGSDDNLWLRVAINEDGHGVSRFDFTEDMCKEMMKTILNGCDNQTIEKKLGGHIVVGDSSGVYSLAARPKSVTEDPFPVLRESTGETADWTWKCIDTDTSTLNTGFFDPKEFEGTCTCFYEQLDKIYDFFDKPEGKGCGDLAREGAIPKFD